MIKHLLVSSGAFLLAATAVAQPVLNFAPTHGIGTQTVAYMVDASAAMVLVTGGPNVSWNLSSVTVTPAGTMHMVDPATTPHAAQFPDANLALALTPTGGTTFYMMLQNTANEMNVLGTDIGGNDPTVYTDYDKVVQYPMAFNDAFTDTRQETGGLVEAFTRTYDAYGTVIINGKTYTDVVRVTRSPTSLVWYTSTPHLLPLLVYNGSTLTYYEPVVWSKIPSAERVAISVSPNPASAAFTIAFGNAVANGTVFELYNAIGQRVASVELSEQATTVDRRDLANGTYFYRVVSHQGVETTGKLTLH